MSIAVRRLTPDDYEALREIRLESLRLHPELFAADPAQEEAAGREEWLARLASAASFGGFADGTLSGLLVFSQPSRPKLAHTGSLGAMYVRQSARGTGLADALMAAVVDHAATVVEQIQLTVNADNTRAVRFYERHGFRTIGRIPRSLLVGDRYYDELMMLRPVSATD
ncbi:MAG TPA: GNAT family N-acetyltransferase [Rhizomicrobium sp.]|jgi:ribosomal protein S18 acetylase RimI-like enzyme|nr:GNAT family N-acetyltransferase [Rhizomicrobium sp.]